MEAPNLLDAFMLEEINALDLPMLDPIVLDDVYAPDILMLDPNGIRLESDKPYDGSLDYADLTMYSSDVERPQGWEDDPSLIPALLRDIPAWPDARTVQRLIQTLKYVGKGDVEAWRAAVNRAFADFYGLHAGRTSVDAMRVFYEPPLSVATPLPLSIPPPLPLTDANAAGADTVNSAAYMHASEAELFEEADPRMVEPQPLPDNIPVYHPRPSIPFCPPDVLLFTTDEALPAPAPRRSDDGVRRCSPKTYQLIVRARDERGLQEPSAMWHDDMKPETLGGIPLWTFDWPRSR